MIDVIKLLEEMGAINVKYHETIKGEGEWIQFEFNGKVATIEGEHFNTGEAGLGGCVEGSKVVK